MPIGLKTRPAQVDTLGVEWIERQWYRGRLAAERRRADRQDRAHRALPLVELRVREQVEVPRSSDEIWRFVTDPANDRAVLGPAHVLSFVVPGTPPGQVGEMQCTVVRRPDGSWTGDLGETLERVEGVRLAVRAMSRGHGHIDAVTVADGTLTWAIIGRTHPGLLDDYRRQWSQNLHAHVTTVAAVLAGGEPTHPVTPFSTMCDQTTPLVDIEVGATVDVPVAPDVAWACISDAATPALGASDPAAVSFPVPGSRQGEVGALVCVIVGTPDGGRTAKFQQVVGLTPGRSIVLRALTTAAEHAWERETTVEAVPGGSRLTHRVRVPVHRGHEGMSRVSHADGAQRYLARVRDRLVASA